MLLLLLVSSLAAPPLTIVKPALRQFESAPVLSSSHPFGTGETVFFDFHVSGYKVSPDQKINLACQVDALDPQGVKLIPTMRKAIETTLSAEDKDWMPVMRDSFLIPPLGLPGTYHLKISIEDKLANTQAEADLPFTVRGRAVEPSDKLVARNFRFLRAEEDQQPLSPAAYRPGDVLWARFDITGFKYGEKNRIDVAYGLAVLGPTGKTLYQQPAAAVEKDETFYPKRYVPGILSLNLQKNAQPGTYTIVLMVKDNVGGQADESKHEFNIAQ